MGYLWGSMFFLCLNSNCVHVLPYVLPLHQWFICTCFPSHLQLKRLMMPKAPLLDHTFFFHPFCHLTHTTYPLPTTLSTCSRVLRCHCLPATMSQSCPILKNHYLPATISQYYPILKKPCLLATISQYHSMPKIPFFQAPWTSVAQSPRATIT